MQFNLQKYPNLIKKPDKKTNSKRNSGESFNDVNEKLVLILPEIINQLNNSNILNIQSEKEVSIIFEDFYLVWQS